MFKGNRNLAVGLFVSVALAAVAGFSMWLAGNVGNQQTTRYSVLFEKDVSGLSLGGPVFYLGVNVGSVVHMSLLPGDTVRVRVDVEVLANTPIDAGSYATLSAQGITGVMVINIAGDPGTHAPLPLSPGFDHPLIPVRTTGLSALLAQAPDTVSKLNLALDQVNLLLGEDNRAAVTQTLRDLETLTAAFNGQREQLVALPGELRTLLADARRTMQELNQLLKSSTPAVETVLANLAQASGELAELAGRVDRLLADHATEFEHFIDNGLGQAPELVFELRQTLRAMQKLLQQLQEDPSQLIHRPPENALEVEP